MAEYLKHGLFSISQEWGFSSRMVACASSAADSLDMWRAYGAHDVSGTYAVGLAADAPLGPLYEDPKTRWVQRQVQEAYLDFARFFGAPKTS